MQGRGKEENMGGPAYHTHCYDMVQTIAVSLVGRSREVGGYKMTRKKRPIYFYLPDLKKSWKAHSYKDKQNLQTPKTLFRKESFTLEIPYFSTIFFSFFCLRCGSIKASKLLHMNSSCLSMKWKF